MATPDGSVRDTTPPTVAIRRREGHTGGDTPADENLPASRPGCPHHVNAACSRGRASSPRARVGEGFAHPLAAARAKAHDVRYGTRRGDVPPVWRTRGEHVRTPGLARGARGSRGADQRGRLLGSGGALGGRLGRLVRAARSLGIRPGSDGTRCAGCRPGVPTPRPGPTRWRGRRRSGGRLAIRRLGETRDGRRGGEGSQSPRHAACRG